MTSKNDALSISDVVVAHGHRIAKGLQSVIDSITDEQRRKNLQTTKAIWDAAVASDPPTYKLIEAIWEMVDLLIRLGDTKKGHSQVCDVHRIVSPFIEDMWEAGVLWENRYSRYPNSKYAHPEVRRDKVVYEV